MGESENRTLGDLQPYSIWAILDPIQLRILLRLMKNLKITKFQIIVPIWLKIHFFMIKVPKVVLTIHPTPHYNQNLCTAMYPFLLFFWVQAALYEMREGMNSFGVKGSDRCSVLGVSRY